MNFCEYIKASGIFETCKDEDHPFWCDVFAIGDNERLDMSIYTKKIITEVLFDKYKNYYYVKSHMHDDYTNIVYFIKKGNE